MPDRHQFRRPDPVPDAPEQPPSLDFYMPVTPSLALMATLEFWVSVYLRRHHFRELFRPFLEEDDQIIADLGFEKADIQWALELPLKVDALKALEACRRARALP